MRHFLFSLLLFPVFASYAQEVHSTVKVSESNKLLPAAQVTRIRDDYPVLETVELAGIPAGAQGQSFTTYVSEDVNSIVPLPQNDALEPLPAVSMINPDEFMINKDAAEVMPATTINELISILPGVYQQRRGGDLSFYGSHFGEVRYYIDGVMQ